MIAIIFVVFLRYLCVLFSSKAGAKVQPFFELTKLLASQERGLKKN
jgi:hypothetical protein